MLTAFDDYPVHQTALPLAHAGEGHPDFYDRFWFNGYAEDWYIAVALGMYPNRGVIDAAFSVVAEGVQRSVFASAGAPLDRTETRVGPISVEVVEPFRVNRVRVDAPEQGLAADLTARARTAPFEEPRQTRHAGNRLVMDVCRATQMVEWSGTVRSGDWDLGLGTRTAFGTKDRSWGVRPVGEPAPAAPSAMTPQVFFLWAPLTFSDACLHYMVFEDAEGDAWSKTAALLPLADEERTVSGSSPPEPLRDLAHHVRWAPGLRRSEGAALTFTRGGRSETVELEPLLTFRMKGAGYWHPTWGHGRWHAGEAVGGEVHRVEDLDTLAPDCLHVQQVMRARWGHRTGLGVLEQLVVGPHRPSGFRDLLDGAPPAART